MGNASNSPPLSSSSQPSYTQPSYQGATQYGSSYVSGSSTVPQASSGRHGGGHVPGRAFTSPPPQQNPNYPQQAYYANQQQQAYASYGQAARGVSSQGQYSQPEVRQLIYSVISVLYFNIHRSRPARTLHLRTTRGKGRKSEGQLKYGVSVVSLVTSIVIAYRQFSGLASKLVG